MPTAIALQESPHQKDHIHILLGIVFGFLYWTMEAVRDVITFERGDIWQRIVAPDAQSLWMRILVICLIVGFGVFAELKVHRSRVSKPDFSALYPKIDIILAGLAFIALYWIIESFREAYIYETASFMNTLLFPDSMVLWTRLMAVFFQLLFSIHVQHIHNEHIKTEQILRSRNQELDQALHIKSGELSRTRQLLHRLRAETLKRKTLEREKEEIQDQLIHAQKLEAVGLVAGGIAHDFNNIITAVMGVSTLAMSHLSKDHALHQDLTEIYNAAIRASDLARQLLMFSREQSFNMAPVKLNEIIIKLETVLKSLMGEDIRLFLHLEDDLRSIQGDKGMLEQIILNLAVNARDAMPGGGAIRLQTRNVYIDKTMTENFQNGRVGHFVCVSVTDQGSGISKENINTIFDPFFTTKKNDKNTGLGLSVVKRIVDKHQGWMHVDTFPERGAVFSIFLPAVLIKHRSETTQALEYQPQLGNGKRILLIEDEKNVREYTKRALDRFGYKVFDSESVKNAKRVYKKEKGQFDLVLSDVILPDGNGLNLVQEFTQMHPALRVVLCSGHMDSKVQWPEIQESGYPFLKKPFILTELLEKIEGAMPAHDNCLHE